MTAGTIRHPDSQIHHRASATSRLLTVGARLGVGPIVRAWMTAPDAAWPLGWVDRAAGALPRPRHTTVRRVSLPHCDAEWIRADSAGTGRAVLYLHGGAFLAFGLNTHRALASCLSAAADAPVLSVGYRMLPRHPIGSSLADAVDGCRLLHEVGYRGGDIVVAGDSAGGYLAFLVASSMPRLGLPALAGVVAISPLTDVGARPERLRGGSRLPVLPPRALQVFARYLPRAHARVTVEGRAGPLVSPVEADVHGFPPVMIHAGAEEVLRADAERMAEHLREAGVRCDLHLWEGQMHAFPVLANATRESRGAILSIGRFVRELTPGDADPHDIPRRDPG